jgi:hypothetical protein
MTIGVGLRGHPHRGRRRALPEGECEAHEEERRIADEPAAIRERLAQVER